MVYKMDLLKVNNVVISTNKYITGYKVAYIDLSEEGSGRNAGGTMRIIYAADGEKFKLSITTKPLTKEELVDFFGNFPKGEINIEYFNPFTGTMKTGVFYRGDREIDINFIENNDVLFNQFTINLTEF